MPTPPVQIPVPPNIHARPPPTFLRPSFFQRLFHTDTSPILVRTPAAHILSLVQADYIRRRRGPVCQCSVDIEFGFGFILFRAGVPLRLLRDGDKLPPAPPPSPPPGPQFRRSSRRQRPPP